MRRMPAWRWLMAIVLLPGCGAARAQQPVRFFLGAEDTITGRDQHRPDPMKFMEFFGPSAPWSQSAAKLSVFQVSTQFLLSAPDSQLKTMFEDMARRGVAVGVEMGTAQREEACGAGEGYLPAAMVDVVGKRVTKLGFRLSYMTMDEPVWFAHEVFWGQEAGHVPCHYPLPQLVAQVALTVRHMRQYFPEIKVGEVEVVGDYADHKMSRAEVLADYAEFARLFEQATGTRLAYWHCDVAWRTDWRPDIAPLARSFRQLGIPFGAIIGGTPLDQSDEAFEATALARLRELQSNPATRLEDIVIQSWQPRPTEFLPETKPGTLTNLLLKAEAFADPQTVERR